MGIFSDKTRYTSIPHDDDDEEEHPKTPQHSKRTLALKFILPSISLLLIASLLSTLYYLTQSPITQCGTSATTARKRGCIFEVTSFSWLPPRCHDPLIDLEFTSHNQTYYRDANYTLPVALSEVQRGDGPGFYVRQDYHVTHCAYLLKKLHRAYKGVGGREVDGVVARLGHTGHCVHMLVDPPREVVEGLQFAFVKWPYCGREGGFNVEWGRQGEWT